MVGAAPSASLRAVVRLTSFASCSPGGRFFNIVFRGRKGSSSGGVFHGWRCAPTSACPPSARLRTMSAVQGSAATWYVVKYVARTPSVRSKPSSRRSSRMFPSVTPSRRGSQLSSSVSIETIRTTSAICLVLRRRGERGALAEARPEPPGPVEDAQPAAAPAPSEHYQLTCDVPHGGPLQLVRFLAPQEIEAPIATLNGTADHRGHQDETNTLVLPLGIPPALIEVDGVPAAKAVPRGGGLAVQIQRREPELVPRRQFAGEAAV